MATEFKITEISTAKHTTIIYLLVEFYVNDSLVHTEDIIISRPKEKRVYVGAIGPNDEILEPDKFLTEPLDIRREILAEIRGFERRHRDGPILTGKHTVRTISDRLLRDQSDPNGWLNRAEVKALKDKKVAI